MLPLRSVHTVTAIAHITHYGRERLVVKIDDCLYQAGEDLEAKVDQLKADYLVRIDKVAANRSTRIKYAKCTIFKKGDWSAMVDYTKMPMMRDFDGTHCVIDVRTVEIKGQKRKLALMDSSEVYRLKKSKFEESVKPGYY